MNTPTPGPGWKVIEEHHLEKELSFPDFASALAFVNRVGALAEEANHHPDIFLTWGKVRMTLFTHTANGLTQKDFDLAERIDRLARISHSSSSRDGREWPGCEAHGDFATKA